MLAIGIYAWKSTRDIGDYLLGGRRLGPWVTALSAGASDMSGWLLLGLPGAVYASGIGESWIVIGLVIGAWCNWRFVARPLRERTAAFDAVTLPDYFDARFQDHSNLLRLVSALVVLVFFTFYAASGLVAGARLFSSVFGMSYTLALVAGAVVIVSYTAIGGFLAVSWTDFVQGTMMAFALTAVPVMIWLELGSVEAAITTGAELSGYLSLFENYSPLVIVSLMAWGLGYMGQPHILVRFMAIRDPALLDEARRVGMSWMLLSTVAAILVGLTGHAYLAAQGQPLAAENTEKIFIVLTQLLFNPWIAGILLAAILAAVMSTIDSQLLVSSSALSEDLYRRWIRPQAQARELVVISRLTVVLIAVVAFLVALDPESRVLSLVSYAWAGLGASFGPVVLMSLYWPAMNRFGALAGMIVGALTVVVWKQLEGSIFDLYELLPAFVMALLAIILGSVLSSKVPAQSHIN
ncbi:MAG: sodium/proline symporter PutP [Pseudomonadales bacterium]|nr:sodium/proline symporter PutP [Pseudomonadales bacterium]